MPNRFKWVNRESQKDKAKKKKVKCVICMNPSNQFAFYFFHFELVRNII